MLVASAAIGLIAPIGAQANDINIESMNSYSRSNSSSKKQQFNSKSFANELATVNDKIDGLESQFNDFEAGGFSDTTTMDGKAVFSIGALDADDSITALNENTVFQYMYVMNLNSSFTGDDNLYVRIKTGNGPKDANGDKTLPFNETAYGTYLSSANQNGDGLKVDKLWYTMPLGDSFTFTAGPKIENYYMHGTTPSIYKPVLKQFTLGGNASAYGASTSPGAGLTWTGDSGLAISTNFTTQKGNSTGILTDKKTSWATQIGYTQPRYSVSAIANIKSNGWSDSYYKAGDINGDATSTDSYTAVGLRGWWRPENTGTATPSISVGYDTTEYDASSGQEQADAWFVGLNWQDIFTPDDRIGAAFGQPTTNESSDVDPFAYEVYYSFKPNDSMTITPTFFGGSDRNGTAAGDITGAVLETTFKF